MQPATYNNDGEDNGDEEESEDEDKDTNLLVYTQGIVIFYIIALNP